MRFWTRQHEAVWDELQKTGQYIVKKEYIEEKNDTISEFYLKLYEWYTKAARKYIDIPEDLKYPVWLSVSEDMMLQPTEHAIIFEVEIPEGEYLICNFDKWGYRVNYFYVPLDEADEKAHMEELKKYGIASEDSLVTTSKGNFYPLLRQKIIKSWDRIFTIQPDDPLVAAVLRFEGVDDRAFTGELNQEVESGGLLLNRVGELLQAPGLAVHNLTAVFGNYTLEFVSDLLDLCIGKDRRDNENGFVIVHNRLLIRLICI